MPIRTPDGYLDITNATLRGSEIITTSKVGIANSAPTHTLSVGNKLFVDDSAANVLTVSGNLVATSLKIGQIDLTPSYGLEHVANVINTVSNVVQFTNTGTGFVSVSNVGIGTSTSPAGLLDVVGAFRMRYQDMGVTKAHIITGGNSTSISESGGTYTYTRGGSGNTGNFLPNPSNIVPNVGQRYRVKLTARSDYAGTIRYECPTSTIITTYDLTTSFKEYTWDFTATGTTMQFAVTTVSGTTSQFNAFSIERLGVGFNVNPTSTAAPVQISGVTHFSDNVGIGTASPSHPLTIQETTTNTNTVTYPLAIRAISSGTVANGFGAGIRFQCERTDTDNYQSLAGSVEVYGAGNLPGTSDLWNMRFGVRNNDTAVTPMTLRYDGNVGIGTNNPIAKLDIDGGAENNTTPALAIRGGLFDPSDLYVLNSYSVTSGVGYAAKVIGVNIKNKVETDNTVQIRNNVGGLISAGAIYFGSDNVNQGIFGVLGGTGNVGTTLAEYLTVRDDGNVGIGTASPLEKLDVYGTSRISSAYPRLDFFCTTGRSTNAWGNSTGAAGDYRIYSNGDASDGTKRSLNFDYGQNTTHTTRMCINADGNVGIGIASPGYKLHVNGSSMFTSGMNLTTSSGYAAFEMGGPSGAYIDLKKPASDDYDLRLITNGTGGNIQVGGVGDVMNFDGSGNVGIGAVNPVAKLHVETNVTQNQQLHIRNNDSTHRAGIAIVNKHGEYFNVEHIGHGSNACIIENFSRVDGGIQFYAKGDGEYRFYTTDNNNERVRILNNGNFGIGLHNPDNTLDVRGNMNVSFDDNSRMKIDSGGTFRRHYLSGGTNYGAGLHFTSDAIFPTDYAGNYVNNQIDLGTSTRKWKGVHTEYLACGGSGQVPVTFTSSSTWQTAINIANSTVPSNTWSFLLGGSGNSTGSAGVGSLGFYVNNGNGFVLNLNANGNVGIGTASPAVKLHVHGSGSSTGAVRYFNYSGGMSGTNQYLGSVTLRTSHGILSGDYVAVSSDERIKKNIIDADDAECLDTLRLLKPKKYRYRDEITKGTDPVWGFIAQEVREILPHSTVLQKKTVPNIYELANVSSSNVITFTNFNTADLESNATTVIKSFGPDNKQHDIHLEEVIDAHSIRVKEDLTHLSGSFDAEGNVISEIVTTTVTPEEYEALEDKTGYVANITGYQNANVSISVEEYNALEETSAQNYEQVIQDYTKTITTYPGNQLFVYGQQVDDFVFLKKEAIWTVATAALQEVDRQLQAEKTKTTTFETELQAEKTKTSTFETKLQEAEAKIATLQAEKEAIRSDLSSLVLRVAALES